MDLRRSEERICYTNPGVPGTSAPGNISYDFTYAGPHGFQVGDAIGYQNDGTGSIIKVGISHTRPQANYIIGICTAAPTLYKFTIGLQGVFDLGSTSPFTSGAGFAWFLTTTNGSLTYIRGADSDKIGADGSKFLRPVLIPFDDNKCFVFGESMLGNYPTINEALDYYSSPLNNNDVLTWDASQLSWTNKPQGGGGHPAFTVQSTTGSVSGVLHDNSATTDGQVFLRKSTGLTWDLVDTANIKPNAITSALIADGTITGLDMATATISGGQIAAHTITAAKITAGTITGTEIASATIAGSNISSNTITGTNIASHTITASNITAATITNAEIASGTIQGSNIASATIANSNLVNTGFSLTLGSGLSGSGSTTLGSSLTLNNTGILGIAAGTGISIAGTSALVTISATGTTPSDATSSVKGILQLAGDLAGSGSSAAAPKVIDATTSVAGKIQLAGDLAGTSTAPVIDVNKIGLTKIFQSAAYGILANATSSTANFTNLTAASNGQIFQRKSNALSFTNNVEIGTNAAGGGTLYVYTDIGKFFHVDLSAGVTWFQSSTAQMVIDNSATMTFSYPSTNTVSIAASDIVGSSKTIKLREIDICVGGVPKKMMILASAAY